MGRPAKSVDFFRVWSAAMAYVLGYWWADGCMRIKQPTGAHEIEIASNDVAHLELVAAAIGEHYSMRRISVERAGYALNYCSKEMYQDLQRLGGTPRKSLTIGFPAVPDAYVPHFVRGVIDGDGTWIWNGDRPVVQIYSGSVDLLKGIATAVAQLTAIPAPNVTTNRSNWTIKWSTTRAKCLAVWLYNQNPGMNLQRKAEIAQAFIEWQPKKKPQKGTITDGMRRNFAGYLPS